MVCYYLLRDNHETGPYTLTELKGKTLFETDLIWADGESTCWKLPNEIPGLEGITLRAKTNPPAVPKKRPAEAISPAIPVTESVSLSPSGALIPDDFSPPDDYTPPSFEALKEKYAQKPPQKRVWTRQINIGANLLGLVTLFIGLGLSAYMIKKAVENIDYEPVIASAEAVEIIPETMQSSSTTHAAFSNLMPTAKKAVLVPDSAAASTATSQTVSEPRALPSPQAVQRKEPLQQSAPKDPSATSENSQVAATQNATATSTESESPANGATVEKEKEATTEKIEEAKKTDKPDGKPALRLAANNYNVGFLGGISNLEISVSNPSGQEVSKAVVEVEFLRPNGKVVGSQTVTVSGIAPGGSKTVSIPDNSRGVNVRYKVVKAER